MSAALQLPVVWGAASPEAVWNPVDEQQVEAPAKAPVLPRSSPVVETRLEFYRKHTESMLRRYLYASMLVGRTPALLANSVGRGWVSSRRVRTFEDAVIFVLDMESCLKKLNGFDRELLTRIVLQDYTREETSDMLRIALRTICYKFPIALDRLTRLLLDAGLLVYRIDLQISRR